jgi:hypothetical protein
MMSEEPKLSENELALIIQLLERERVDIPVQMHEARNTNERATLQYRSEVVRKALATLQSNVAATH